MNLQNLGFAPVSRLPPHRLLVSPSPSLSVSLCNKCTDSRLLVLYGSVLRGGGGFLQAMQSKLETQLLVGAAKNMLQLRPTPNAAGATISVLVLALWVSLAS